MLTEGHIDSINFYYVHNLRESVNVEEELSTLTASLKRRLADDEAWAQHDIEGQAYEYGIRTAVSLQEQKESGIRLNTAVTLSAATVPQKVDSTRWTAYTFTALGEELAALGATYPEELYSSNVRDYLGSRATRNNINNQIQSTARDDPSDFWVFNNGVTAITHEFVKPAKDKITVRGLSIVNGAQTVGSLAALQGHLSGVRVPIRIVCPIDSTITNSIIRFNNTQNTVEAWELRSIDKVQDRLADAFRDSLGLTYERRRSAGRRSSEGILFEKLAPWSMAFSGDAGMPHRNKREIYESDEAYSSIFRFNSDVRNLLFVYRVGEAIQALKDEYKARAQTDPPDPGDEVIYGYFQYGAFQYALIQIVAAAFAAIARSGRDDFHRRVRFCEDSIGVDRGAAIQALSPAINFVLLAVPSYIGEDPPYAMFRSREQVEKLATRAALNVRQHEALNRDAFDAVRSVLCVD